MQAQHNCLDMWHGIWQFLVVGTSDSGKVAGDVNYLWPGNGTRDDPYVVSWNTNDTFNARNYFTVTPGHVISICFGSHFTGISSFETYS